ncbi:MAG: tetratricopeptide repeat protein [Piscinibacter sp.]|nr:tetratricopeptide repeat protein [Piscinibacter sp.]
MDGTAGPSRLLPERRYRLLAYLALRGDWVGRDELAGLFWPERGQASARSNLRKLLLETRALALPEFESDVRAVRFAVQTDVAAFDAALASGDAAAAVAWVRGPLMQGLDGGDSRAFEGWLAEQRLRHQSRWHEAAATLLPGLAPEAALQLAERLLDDDPFDEEALVAALSAHHARRDAAAAERLYRRHADRLADELGIEPSARVRAAAAATVDRRAAPSHPAEDAASAPLPTDFFGREADQTRLASLLADPACRLITVVGCGGVGKTRLAKEVLRACADRYADGTLWLALDDLDDVDHVPMRLVRECGLTLGPRQLPLQRAELHLADRQMLLVLDNAEHLRGLELLVSRLLAAAPRLQILVTSRRRLGSADEATLMLRGLSIPAAAHDPASPSGDGAVQYFAACARAANPRFDLASQRDAVTAVVRAVDGLPLAIMLAASWVRMLPMADLVEEVRQSLDVLESVEDGEERAEHGSVNATFESSWCLLAPAEQEALAALSVMVGRFSRRAAVEVAQAPLPLLAGLVDKSLLQLDDDGRFSLHPLIQRFAARKLASRETATEAARDRHARACGRFMAEHVQFEVGDPRPSLRAIGIELPNVLAAWRWAVERRLLEVLDACAVGLSNHYQSAGPMSEGADLFARAQAVVDASPPAALRGAPNVAWRVAIERAALSFWLGDFRNSEHCARSALGAARVAGSDFGVRTSLNTVALATMRQGRLDDARILLQEALAMAEEARVHHETAAYAGNLVGIVREIGDDAGALKLAQRALQGHRDNSSILGQVATLNEIGLILHGLGRRQEAIAHYEQGIAIAGDADMGLLSAQSLTHLASVCLEDGQLARGREAVKLSLRLTLEANLLSHEPTCRRTFAMIELASGDADRAREHLLAAVSAARRVGTALVGTPVLRDAAIWLAQAGDLVSALSCVSCADAGRVSKAALLGRFQDQRRRLRAALSPQAADDAEAVGMAMSVPIGLEFAERAMHGSGRDATDAVGVVTEARHR